MAPCEADNTDVEDGTLSTKEIVASSGTSRTLLAALTSTARAVVRRKGLFDFIKRIVEGVWGAVKALANTVCRVCMPTAFPYTGFRFEASNLRNNAESL